LIGARRETHQIRARAAVAQRMQRMGNPQSNARELETTGDFPLAAPREVRVEYWASSHVGKVREVNEDHYVVARLVKALRVVLTNLPKGESPRLGEEEAYLFAVADGMGGAAAGERASALVIAEMERYLLQTSKWFFRRHEREEGSLQRDVDRGLRELDQIVYNEGESDFARAGMGTTLTAAISVGHELTVIHVGDSRAYLVRGGSISRITHDHTIAQVLVDGGVLSPDQAQQMRSRHVLTNVLGGPSPGVSGEVHTMYLQNRDRLLICSDGLTNMVCETEITALLNKNSQPKAACDALVSAALDQGGRDNITVLVADFTIIH
jgi:PPM family protein phosphatase